MLPHETAELLREEEFVKFWAPRPNETEEITLAANAHLLTFLGEETGTDKFQQLVADVLEAPDVERGLTNHPDYWEDIDRGRRWLQEAPNRGDLLSLLGEEAQDEYRRALTFLIRTFLYLACANKAELNFRPDTARTIALEPILNEEERLRERIISNLQEQLGEAVKDSYRKLVQKPAALPIVSPFTAIVFERARGEKEAIPREMRALREKTAELRKKVRDIEIRWQGGSSAEDADKAKREWENVLKEISEEYWKTPTRTSVLSIATGKRALKFAGSSGAAVMSLAAGDLIAAFLAGLPALSEILDLPPDTLRKLFQGSTVVEMHRLRPREVPNPNQLPALVESLFGPSA